MLPHRRVKCALIERLHAVVPNNVSSNEAEADSGDEIMSVMRAVSDVIAPNVDTGLCEWPQRC
ncbi:hypothetical protein JYU12_00890, partial [bacterium AH-315-K03]|nr:hypothetical protein [bacterium AH-315-K03]